MKLSLSLLIQMELPTVAFLVSIIISFAVKGYICNEMCYFQYSTLKTVAEF